MTQHYVDVRQMPAHAITPGRVIRVPILTNALTEQVDLDSRYSSWHYVYDVILDVGDDYPEEVVIGFGVAQGRTTIKLNDLRESDRLLRVSVDERGEGEDAFVLIRNPYLLVDVQVRQDNDGGDISS